MTSVTWGEMTKLKLQRTVIQSSTEEQEPTRVPKRPNPLND